MQNGFWQANFPDLHGLPKSSPCHLNVTQPVWQEILVRTLESQLEPGVPYSGKLKENGSPWSQLYPDLGGFDLAPATNCGQRQLGMAGVQDAIASFGGIFTRR